MKTRWVRAGLVCAALGAAAAGGSGGRAAWGANGARAGGGGARAVARGEARGGKAGAPAESQETLPANVQALVEKQVPGGTIVSAEEQVDEGRHLYFVKVQTEGAGGKMVTVLASGRAQYLGILDASDDDDLNDDATYLEVDTAPAAVRSAISKAVGDAKVNALSFEVDGERFFYIAEFDKEGKTHFDTFTLQGELTEEETDIAVTDLPAAVKAGVSKARPAAKIDSASEVVAKKQKSYAVDVTDGGKKFELMVSEAGAVASSESLDDDPAPGKKGG
ncbi:MAG TPA: hypothetical protein VH253_17730 [Phycisphaerae bacterium]|nr:hypothetical protein [Phycisphaerae bacterium]